MSDDPVDSICGTAVQWQDLVYIAAIRKLGRHSGRFDSREILIDGTLIKRVTLPLVESPCGLRSLTPAA